MGFGFGFEVLVYGGLRPGIWCGFRDDFYATVGETVAIKRGFWRVLAKLQEDLGEG